MRGQRLNNSPEQALRESLGKRGCQVVGTKPSRTVLSLMAELCLWSLSWEDVVPDLSVLRAVTHSSALNLQTAGPALAFEFYSACLWAT